jgi:hypothetical protein
MILEGNQRGGARNLALHLLKDENDHVDVHELRGFVSDRLLPALNEAYAVSRGTRAKKFLFSLSLNPPPGEEVSTEKFMDAINRAEAKLKLDGQARAIVFHHKHGRRHCHAVWSRIDPARMKAIHLSHTKLKLMDLSRELYFEHGWKMPAGFIRGPERDSNNFTLAEWQRAKRLGFDPLKIKNTIKDCWVASADKAEFQQLLAGKGLVLATGDRPYLVVDQYCQVYAIPRAINQPVKIVRDRLGDTDKVQKLEKAREAVASAMQAKISTQHATRDTAIHARLEKIEVQQAAFKDRHKHELETLSVQQTERLKVETLARQARFNKGWKGLFDRVTGRRRKTEQQNELEYKRCQSRDAAEKDALLFEHVAQNRKLFERKQRLAHYRGATAEMIESDMKQYADIERGLKDHFVFEARPRGGRPSRER